MMLWINTSALNCSPQVKICICKPNCPGCDNDFPDEHAPLGAHGIGEIGITGAAAAIANAIFHATGKAVRDLPITIDKLL
jgi:hypothetical protein